MGAVAGSQTNARRTSRRLLWVALLSGGALFVALAFVFVWPSAESKDGRFDLGPVDDYAFGSVNTVDEGKFHVVRLSEDTFIALSWVDPHLGCTVPWRPDFVWGSNGGRQGWFRNPCHGETYDSTGHRVFGPSPRDLDRYLVAIVNGRVIVETDRYVCGFAPPGALCVGPTPTP